jgi:leader peptidase (prepilin peptidase) / N-methyltransferase
MTPNLLVECAVGAALGALMIAIAVSDWRCYRVPDRLIALALGLRAIEIVVATPTPRGEAAIEAIARAAAMAALFWLFRWTYRRVRGREGLGLGDVKLAAVAGAWVDWPLLPFVVEAAAAFGLALALYRAVRSRATLRAETRLPFAVGFAAAIFLGWQAQHVNL